MSRLPSNIERSIKSKIEMTKCSVHGEHPKVTFDLQFLAVVRSSVKILLLNVKKQ